MRRMTGPLSWGTAQIIPMVVMGRYSSRAGAKGQRHAWIDSVFCLDKKT
jgi:hypothetical protein